jgi:hypothetical protein
VPSGILKDLDQEEESVLTVQKAKHRTIEVDGVKLFYREAGRRDAPGLLLLHGQPSSIGWTCTSTTGRTYCSRLITRSARR